jgi:hypothetical protein
MSEQNQKTLLRLARAVIEAERDPEENVRKGAAEVLDKLKKVTVINAD